MNLPKKASRKPTDWHPADIKAALHKEGKTLASIAAEHQLGSASSLSFALSHSSPAAEQRIADALAIHPMVIWPSRYNEDGTRKPQGFRALQCNAPSNRCNVNAMVGA